VSVEEDSVDRAEASWFEKSDSVAEMFRFRADDIPLRPWLPPGPRSAWAWDPMTSVGLSRFLFVGC